MMLTGKCSYSCSGCCEEDQDSCIAKGDAWFQEPLKTAVILSHNLTEEQVQYLGGEVIELPQDLKKVWGQVPAEGDYEEVKVHLNPIFNWIRSLDLNQIVCQGEFSAFAHVLEWGLPVLVATSRRETVETVVDGVSTKTAVFKHVRFRRIR